MNDENEVIAEDPTIVIGGPGGETPPAAEIPATPPAAKSLHKGFNGEITTPEDLVRYTQNLETLLVQRPAVPVTAPTPPSFSPTRPNAPLKGESFEDLVYSDPARAKEVLLQEWDQKQEAKTAQQTRVKNFWKQFYIKNPDLKEMDGVVDSIFKRDQNEFSDLKRFSSDTLVTEHIASEARSIIGLVKEKTGVRETRVSSSPAMTFGGAGVGHGVPTTAQPQKPVSFSDQLAAMRKKRGK